MPSVQGGPAAGGVLNAGHRRVAGGIPPPARRRAGPWWGEGDGFQFFRSSSFAGGVLNGGQRRSAGGSPDGGRIGSGRGAEGLASMLTMISGISGAGSEGGTPWSGRAWREEVRGEDVTRGARLPAPLRGRQAQAPFLLGLKATAANEGQPLTVVVGITAPWPPRPPSPPPALPPPAPPGWRAGTGARPAPACGAHFTGE